jgi:hypothetical protein
MKFTTMKVAMDILSLALLATTTGVTAADGQVRAYHPSSLLVAGSFRTDKEVTKTTLSTTYETSLRTIPY